MPTKHGAIVTGGNKGVQANLKVFGVDQNTGLLVLLKRFQSESNGLFVLPLQGKLASYRQLLLAADSTKEGNATELLDTRTWEQPVSLSLAPSTEAHLPTAVSITPARIELVLSKQLTVLPLRDGRSFDQLALLTPGVLLPPATFAPAGPGISAGVGASGQFTVNGLRSRENDFTVDGSDNNDEEVGARRQGFVAVTPQPPESITEFTIIAALPDATFGHNIGAQVNALTATGGTQYQRNGLWLSKRPPGEFKELL